MSGGITVKEFKHIPGVNDAEYIKKLEELNEINQRIINKAVAKIKMLSVQPERKKGKWVYDNGLKQFFCDQCGEPSLTYDDIYIYGMDFTNFCPNCGADMRGEQDQKEEKQKEKA